MEKVFESKDLKAGGKKCSAIRGIINEGEEVMKETAEGSVRDASVITSVQKVEH